MSEEIYEWDAFICHASEDKDLFVRELADKAQLMGIRVWYDEFSLSWGDSLLRSIDRGLAKARYGVVVLSQNFFRKEWPQKELDGLAVRERQGDKVILPIWLNVKEPDVSRYSPILSSRLAVKAEDGIDKIVGQLLSILHPTVKTISEPLGSHLVIDLQKLSESCERQKEFHLARHSREYDRERYVPRTLIEDQFREFVESERKICFPIIGEAGMGKTTLICHVADLYSQLGHLVWVFPARPLRQIRNHPLQEDPDLERAFTAFLTQHLTSSDGERQKFGLDDLVEALHNAWAAAHDEKARFLVLVDAINEHPEPEQLIVSMERLIQGLVGLSERIKICVTSRPYTWKRAIRDELGNQILYTHYFGLKERSPEPSSYLGDYSYNELRAVYANLKLRPDYDSLQRQAPLMAERLRDPYMLACASEIARNQSGQVPIGFTKTELLRTYINYLVQDDKGTERFLLEVTGRMRSMLNLSPDSQKGPPVDGSKYARGR